jgi:hypothetical protein
LAAGCIRDPWSSEHEACFVVDVQSRWVHSSYFSSICSSSGGG